MKPSKINVIFFSATGTTEKTVKALAEGTGIPAVYYNCTKLYEQAEIPPFDSEDLVVFGAPVYRGRVPTFMQPIIDRMQGNQTPCVILGVYGNRHYDDYLIELYDRMKEKGFIPVAAAAFIGEHSFSGKLARGRPDTEDLKTAFRFGGELAAKLREKELEELELKEIPGNRPYKPLGPPPKFADRAAGPPPKFTPVVGANCVSCGDCARACPSGAIRFAGNAVQGIDPEKCLWCRACARACPEKAIEFADPGFLAITEGLIKGFSEYKQVELFL